jgi:hypothetical protein
MLNSEFRLWRSIEGRDAIEIPATQDSIDRTTMDHRTKMTYKTRPYSLIEFANVAIVCY